VTDEIVTLFESDLDFRRQVKAGDKVRVIYQTKQVDGRDLGDYRLVAVRFEASGQTYEALYFESEGTKRGNFYDAEGKSVKRGFLAAPLRFTRVSSSFSSYRLHPLFGDPRAHQGVDYAAPVGTPVRAVADGDIVSVGFNGGYGNAVGIQHNQRYSTYYAHLSRFAPGIKNGRSVRMGEVIGYVGTTGWATGPHLHYEFRVHGRSIDPTKIAKENPQVPSLSGPELTQFSFVAADLRKRLSLLDSVNTAAGPSLPTAAPTKSAKAANP
jgi:murein DD-endopeptidase MepM/ murein hydrolase activator NlpD